MNFGLDPKVFRQIIYDMVHDRAAIRNVEETVDAIEFEYTYWAKPDNMTAVRQNLIDVITRKFVFSMYAVIIFVKVNLTLVNILVFSPPFSSFCFDYVNICLLQMWSDQVYGWCMDAMLKYHACDYSDARNEDCEPVYMYEFAHRSEYESLPLWMGLFNFILPT